MEETKNQLIQTGFTLDRLHQDGKIDAEAYTILKDRNKQAINYSQCCETLPSKEEMALEKKKTFERINEGITKLDKLSYGVGFRKCFSWLSKDKDY